MCLELTSLSVGHGETYFKLLRRTKVRYRTCICYSTSTDSLMGRDLVHFHVLNRNRYSIAIHHVTALQCEKEQGEREWWRGAREES